MQYIDQPDFGKKQILNPEQAVITGLIKTDNVDDLRTFQRLFPFKPEAVIKISNEVRGEAEASGGLSAGQKADIIFDRLLPEVFTPSAAPGWTGNIHFKIDNTDSHTVTVADGRAKVQEGLHGEPTSSVSMDAETMSAIMRFEALRQADQLDEVNIVESEESMDAELDDSQLELVAGGKGTCAAEACGGDACGAEATGAGACGGAACGAAACGADACGADACGGAACGGAACGAAVSGVGVCGGDACAAAAGGAGACGGAACAADACGAAACGLAAGGATACGADACGIAACGADACAADACGIDVIPGVPLI